MPKATLPVLYHKSKTGKMVTWRVWTEGAYVCTEYGQVDGKLQRSKKKAVATNVGRSNERTAVKQALFDAKSLWQGRLDRKYRKTTDEAKVKQTLPMLAEKFDQKKAKTYKWPATVQPKLDGVRCTAFLRKDGSVYLQSRNGKAYHVKHIEAAAKWAMKKNGVRILDGEIYAHGLTFQEISSLVKRAQPESLKLQYHLYDVPSPNLWYIRHKVLATLRTCRGVVVVEGKIANGPKAVRKIHDEYVKDGYEGAIVRLVDGAYEWGHRSKHLLKYKTSQDAEFKVFKVEQGKGRMLGCALFWCHTKEGEEFSCIFKSTMEVRRQQWKDRKKYIGKMLTVRFNGYTDDGSVRFPRGIKFRDGKDLPK